MARFEFAGELHYNVVQLLWEIPVMASVSTSIRIEQQLAQRLARAAVRLARGKNWIVTQALEEYLAKVNRDDLAAEARRQSRLIARSERRMKPDNFWEEDMPEWR